MIADFFAPFSFLRPAWLLGLVCLPFVRWIWNRWPGESDWSHYVDPEKLAYLKVGESQSSQIQGALSLAFLAIALVALAGPSFRSLPVPVQKARDALVVAFDLSPSMLASDLEPDRLTRARLKIIDFLRQRQEGETALIAYADDAYRVSPLTDDARTIEALMPSLHPSTMPASGSRVEAAFEMARELFRGAGIQKGGVLLVTDGIDPEAFPAIERTLDSEIQLCILAVGGTEGVPIPMPRGGYLRDQSNEVVLASVNLVEMEAFAARHGGCFVRLTTDDSDLARIDAFLRRAAGDSLDETEETFVKKVDEGHWLVLLLLPLAALAFRKNAFWIALITSSVFAATPEPARAFDWQDLWARPDQQRYRTLNEGIDHYRKKDYASAAEAFAGSTPTETYNRANALALEGKLEEALTAYEQTLEANPEHADARFNRDLVARLLEQESNQQQSQNGGEQGEENESSSQDEGAESDASDQGAPADDSGSRDQESTSGGESGENDSPSPPSDAQERDASDSSEDGASGTKNEPNAEADEASETGSAEEEAPEAVQDMSEAIPAESESAPLSERSEQWLRKIPDDPGGLMRRKFEYQAEQRRLNEARRRRRDASTRY